MISRISLILAVSFLAVPFTQAQMSNYQKTLAEHQLLARYLGHMTFQKMMPGPDREIQGKGKLEGKMLGPYFLILEWSGDIYGNSFKALQTLGFDIDKKRYAGQWIDSQVNYQWDLKGRFDQQTNQLVLEASGPGPFGITKYREIHRYLANGRIEITGQMYQDEAWESFMITVLERKK